MKSRRPAAITPSSARANAEPMTGMAGKRHLVAGAAEDAQTQVGAGGLGGQRERALREVHLPGHRRHGLGGQALRLHEHGELVAGVRAVGEDVVVQVASQVGQLRRGAAGLSAPTPPPVPRRGPRGHHLGPLPPSELASDGAAECSSAFQPAASVSL